jgi:hypothetical protein
MFGHSWKFIIGMTLLLTNQVVGWGGVALCAYAVKKTGKKCYYAYGTGIYALSWGMIVLGIVLAGPEGAALARQLLKTHGWQILIAVAIVILGVVFYVRNKKRNAVPATVHEQAK